MDPQKHDYIENKSFNLSNKTDVESQSLESNTQSKKSIHDKLIIQRHDFMARNWSNFKQHFKYQIAIEFELLKDYKNWLYIVIGLGIIYLHLASHNLAYYLAKPAPPLRDLLHDLVPQLSTDSIFFAMNTYVLLFMFAILAMTGFSIMVIKYPPVLKRTLVGFINRYFMVINITQLMRITTFLVTQIPAPSPDCQQPYFDPPKTFRDVFARSAGSGDKGCGDLIFSSHIMFGLLIVLLHIKYLGLNKHERLETDYDKMNLQSLQAYNDNQSTISEQGAGDQHIIVIISKRQYIFRMSIIALLIFCFVMDIIFILASRKHYSVDIVLSLYITYMVWHIMAKKFKDPKVPSHLVDK